MRINFDPDRIVNLVRQAAALPLRIAGNALVAEIKESISIAGPEPSAPGEPPHRQTSELYDSVEPPLVDASTMTVSVVVGAPHAFYQEYGTVNMEARPFLRPALARYAEKYGSRHFVGFLGAAHSPDFDLEAT